MENNFRDRRKPTDMIIIHSMGEYIGDKFAYDFLDEIGLSAHYLVDSAGNVIHGVPHKKVAFHAGKSAWQDREDLNEYSIGIEMLIKGHHNWESFVEAIEKPESFTDDHYKKTAKICRDLMNIYDITKDKILAHSTVSGPDVRPDPKLDPGEGFDMQKLKDLI